MENKIKCNSCNMLYNSIFPETNQGEKCASTVNFKYNEVSCHYGSELFDMNVYEFTNGEVPDWVESGTICDECIQKLILNSNIIIKRKGIL